MYTYYSVEIPVHLPLCLNSTRYARLVESRRFHDAAFEFQRLLPCLLTLLILIVGDVPARRGIEQREHCVKVLLGEERRLRRSSSSSVKR